MKNDRLDKINIIKETLNIMNEEFYIYKGKTKKLKLSNEEMSNVMFYSQEQVDKMLQDDAIADEKNIDEEIQVDSHRDNALKRCDIKVLNIDSFEAAFTLSEKENQETQNKILVLNFANPIHPGGGVRTGACAQEEELCRKSTLLKSLESNNAADYYEYNKTIKGYWSSDAIVVSPSVEVFRDGQSECIEDSFVVAVISVAAPCVTNEDKENPKLPQLLYKRIMGMLHIAAKLGYRQLVLGAWGCGAFNNDAKMVAKQFEFALKDMNIKGKVMEDFFDSIVMAVLDNSYAQYNYKSFYKYFLSYYKEADEKEAKKISLHINKNENKYFSKIKGCIVGGAIGDALGYSVEFKTLKEIKDKYGKNGISQYELVDQKALISDGTQMTLFTANGIIYGETKKALSGVMGDPEIYVYEAYLDWLEMQTGRESKHKISWLLDIEELKTRRSPGYTCIEALSSEKMGTMENKINDSKGSGGIMRVAPIALYYHFSDDNIDKLDMIGAKTAAITNGHNLGYMPAAALVHIVSRAAFGGCIYGDDIYDIVKECMEAMLRIFPNEPDILYMLEIIDKAVVLSKNDETDEDNIALLGQGWWAEETLAIAIYCSLRHSDNFDKAILAATNHDGDSNKTAAVTGNIMGAYLGLDSIDNKWIEPLELKETIEEIALDLCHKCQMRADNSYMDEKWMKKYKYI